MSDINYKEFIKENWESIKDNVRSEYEIADISYMTWIKPLQFNDFSDNTVKIIIPSNQTQAFNYITNKFGLYFKVTISEMIEHEIEVKFIFEKDIDKENETVNKTVYNINYENANLNAKYRFDTFVVGSNNKLAQSAALAVAESPGNAFNPLFLYGRSGLGKTHLMHSIGHFILDQNPTMKVLYVTSETFTNEVINALRSNNSSYKMSEIRDKYRSVDVLLIDDIQDLIGKEATQQEFFNTFNVLHSAGKQIIISSDKPPKELEPLEERFISRFEWGLIADIQAPDYETRMAILKQNAENDGKSIDDEVLKYIAERITSNIRELEGAYNKLKAFSKLHKVDISMEIVEEALKDIISDVKVGEVTPDIIISVVADQFNITVEDIISKRRTADLVLPRQICMYLCKELTQIPLQDIAGALNKKDHTTVMHGIKRISEDIEVDKSLAKKIETIKTIISPS